MMRCSPWLGGLLAGLFAAPLLQDPEKPAPPVASPTAIVQQPAASEVPGRPPRHAMEGVYELRRRVVNNQPHALPSHGYLAITQRHLFLYLAAPSLDPALPLVRASVRTWQPQKELVRTTIKLGWFTDQEGVVHLEPPGTEEPRRLELIRGGLRVLQDERNWLEFERVE